MMKEPLETRGIKTKLCRHQRAVHSGHWTIKFRDKNPQNEAGEVSRRQIMEGLTNHAKTTEFYLKR